jgi:hypothetical protein
MPYPPRSDTLEDYQFRQGLQQAEQTKFYALSPQPSTHTPKPCDRSLEYVSGAMAAKADVDMSARAQGRRAGMRDFIGPSPVPRSEAFREGYIAERGLPPYPPLPPTTEPSGYLSTSVAPAVGAHFQWSAA